jgi:hypothetical protein
MRRADLPKAPEVRSARRRDRRGAQCEFPLKRLSLLKEMLPQLRRVAMLWNKGDRGMSLRYEASAVAARELGVIVQPLGVSEPDDFITPSAARSVAAMPSARDRSSAFPDILLLPLLGRHRLVANGVPRTDLDLVDEHAEVLADRDQRPMLVVHLHAQTVRGLRNLGNREAGLGRQRRAVDDQDAALKHLAHWLVGVVRVLELLVDELWSPAHDLADVGEAEHRQFAQNLLDRDFGPLGAGSEDFFDASANANICKQWGLWILRYAGPDQPAPTDR